MGCIPVQRGTQGPCLMGTGGSLWEQLEWGREGAVALAHAWRNLRGQPAAQRIPPRSGGLLAAFFHSGPCQSMSPWLHWPRSHHCLPLGFRLALAPSTGLTSPIASLPQPAWVSMAEELAEARSWEAGEKGEMGTPCGPGTM